VGHLQVNDSEKLAGWIAARTGARDVRIDRFESLGGGAVQRSLLADLWIDGVLHRCVIRADAPSTIAASNTRAQEFAILRVAFAAGVSVPEPLWLCEDRDVLGTAFFVMRRLEGTALGRRIVRDGRLGGDRATLAARLGRQLARIHAIAPPCPGLSFLSLPQRSRALDFIDEARRTLDAGATARPALEWGLRWLERSAPALGEIVLTHGDFRTGNYLLDEDGITGILDWEFAAWGDPLEDLGWFCAKCWRFGANHSEAGGIGARQDFYDGYEAARGRSVDRAAVAYWEIFAHARWATIAIQQADRHLGGRESSLELALTASIVPELEYELLKHAV
jgi:aminoglycoside phosphotransferase (APT) family kinase protein